MTEVTPELHRAELWWADSISGVGAPSATYIGIAELDLGDGSSNSWNDTTCPECWAQLTPG